MASTENVWTRYDQLDYYDLLGIDAGATTDTIQSAYRERIRTFHPDVCPEDRTEAATAITSRLNAARQVLSEQPERQQYDRLGHDAYCRQIGNGDHVRGGAESELGTEPRTRTARKARTDTDSRAGSSSRSRSRSRPGSEATAGASADDGAEDKAGAGPGSDAASEGGSSGGGSSTTSEATDSTGGHSVGGAAGHGGTDGTSSGDATATDHERSSTARTGGRTKTTPGSDDEGWYASSSDWFDGTDDRRRADERGTSASGSGSRAGAAAGGGATTTASHTWSQADVGPPEGVLDYLAHGIGLVIGIPLGILILIGTALEWVLRNIVELTAAAVFSFLIFGWMTTSMGFVLNVAVLPLLNQVSWAGLAGFVIAELLVFGVAAGLLGLSMDSGMGPLAAQLTGTLTSLYGAWLWLSAVVWVTMPVWRALPGTYPTLPIPLLRTGALQQVPSAIQGAGAIGLVIVLIHLGVFGFTTLSLSVMVWSPEETGA